MGRDFGLYSGERQVASTYDDVRRDHRRRYEWADRCVPRRGLGLDAFCGNGYGAWLLARRPGRTVLALDASAEAIELARTHFSAGRVFFAAATWPFPLPREAFDFVVCLESLEHVEDGERFFDAVCRSLRPGGVLVYSTPNEDLLPLAGTGNPFHFRHYTLSESLDLPVRAGLRVVDWAGQDVYQVGPDRRQGPLLEPEAMDLKPRTAGQFTIVHARRGRTLGSWMGALAAR